MLQAERDHTQNLKSKIQSTGAATDMKLSPDQERARELAAKQREAERQLSLEKQKEKTEDMRARLQKTGSRTEMKLNEYQVNLAFYHARDYR